MQKYAFAVEVPTLLDIYCEGFGAHLSVFFQSFSRLPSIPSQKTGFRPVGAILKSLGFF